MGTFLIDLASTQETRQEVSSTEKRKGYIWKSGATPMIRSRKPFTTGAAMTISNRIINYTGDIEVENDRITRQELHTTPLPTNVINIYGPTVQRPRAETVDFWKALTNTFLNIRKTRTQNHNWRL